ncbi:putative glycosyltransferase [Caenibius tardaugens NBRC 16725]|uniref:Putative glycosyltransferase n=1 Tax=Caenibius tardaugens NBRC 16725 TaxID=1219035 RepID=U2YL16_9SPHN|nr:glycosyltransferase [Caenibius tardaugens]AZI36627.1 glycosyltransferase [Caenibius tardaugens NBRC 16725]GAD49280.1 putative glycosyltransferase [Caenibius tardaugens NBRC 16725]
MRVLTFLHSFEHGGVERIALRLVRQWRASGVDAPLFLGRTDGAMRHDAGEGLAFETPPRVPASVAFWETLWMIWQLPRVVRQLRPDVLFCAGNTYVVVAVALKIILGRQCPAILAKMSNDLERRDAPWWIRKPYHLWLRIQARFLDHVVGMAAPMADDIRSLLAIPDTMISVIPNPALTDDLILRLRSLSRTPMEAPFTGRRFVFVGRLTRQKNLGLMLRAFASAGRWGDTLTLFGDGPDRAKLQKLAVDLGIDDAVDFRGYVSEPAVLLPQFDIFLLSSDYEGVPGVVLEALAAGLPIIATDCSSSMAPLLQHGALGTLIRTGDGAAFARAIAAARPGMQSRALSLAQARRFTLEQAARSYLDAMSKLQPVHLA